MGERGSEWVREGVSEWVSGLLGGISFEYSAEKILKIFFQVLVVSSSAPSIIPSKWLPSMTRFRARTGVVSSINVNAATVTLVLYDAELAVKYNVELPLICVHRPHRSDKLVDFVLLKCLD